MTDTVEKSPKEMLAKLEQARLNLKFLRAAEAKDWNEALGLSKAGANFHYRAGKAVRLMIEDCTPESISLFETLGYGVEKVPFIIPAARQGKADIVESALLRDPEDTTLRAALRAALENNHMDIARRIFPLVNEKQVDNVILYVTLEKAPDMHKQELAKTPPNESLYRMLFEKACLLDDRGLMEMTWENLALHFPPQPYDHALHMMVARMGHSVAPLQFFIEKCAPDVTSLKNILCCASMIGDNRAVTEFFIEHHPELAKAKCHLVLKCTLKSPQAGGEDPSAAFFRALEKDIPLPEEDIHRVDVAVAAADNGADAAFAYLLRQIEDKQLLITRLQGSAKCPALRHAAALSGDLHFNNNALFWRSLQAGDAAFVGGFPAQSVSSIPPAFPTADVFEKITFENNKALFEAALEKIDWDRDSLEPALRGCIKSLEFTERLFGISDSLPEDRQLVPGEIGVIDAIFICGSTEADKILPFLKKRGFFLSPFAANSALKTSIAAGNKPAAAYLLAEGADFDPVALAAADEAMLELLAQYTARHIPVPDGFLSFLKNVPPENLKPDLLLEPRDVFGNNALDILSAQGRLGDILLPELWKNADAQSFLQQHVHENALAQCDFEALRSGISRLRLKQNAPSFRLSPKGLKP